MFVDHPKQQTSRFPQNFLGRMANLHPVRFWELLVAGVILRNQKAPNGFARLYDGLVHSSTQRVVVLAGMLTFDCLSSIHLSMFFGQDPNSSLTAWRLLVEHEILAKQQ